MTLKTKTIVSRITTVLPVPSHFLSVFGPSQPSGRLILIKFLSLLYYSKSTNVERPLEKGSIFSGFTVHDTCFCLPKLTAWYAVICLQIMYKSDCPIRISCLPISDFDFYHFPFPLQPISSGLELKECRHAFNLCFSNLITIWKNNTRQFHKQNFAEFQK